MYEKVKEMLYEYKTRKTMLKYSTLGLIMCFLKIPMKRNNHYFCSQFVAEVLQNCKVLKLKKRSTLYFPKDLSKHEELKLVFTGTHLEFVEKFVKMSRK